MDAKRSELRNGLTRRQRVFVLEKLAGLNDRNAALAAGYSLSVAENTKQRIWKLRVRVEFERIRNSIRK
jgi:phage terminase small subunit